MPRKFHALAVFTAAAAAFSIQPLSAKALLPALGGAPGVWSVVAAFFMLAVLFGYLTVHAVHRAYGVRGTVVLAVVLFAGALATMPLELALDAEVLRSGAVGSRLLARLAFTLGLPALALATVAPLVQSWLVAAHPDEDPYPLYAASNLGSLLGLVAYPFVVEPFAAVDTQLIAWSLWFGVSVLLVLSRAPWRLASAPTLARPQPTKLGLRLQWVWHAALPAAALLAVTDYATTDLAPVPLLWVVPLALYLGTYAVAFSRSGTNVGDASAAISPVAGAVVVPLVILGVSLPVVPVVLAMVVWFCLAGLTHHGRLAQLRPPPTQLTSFYAHLALGGALGGAAVAFGAPLLLSRAVEFPLLLAAVLASTPTPESARARWGLAALVAACGVVLLVYARVELRGGVTVSAAAFSLLVLPFVLAVRRPTLGGRVLALVTVAGVLALELGSPVLESRRSFFAAHRVVQDEELGLRWLAHGRTIHGAQSMDPRVAGQCLPYHHEHSPIAAVFDAVQSRDSGARIAVVGLGVGCLAAHRRGDAEVTFVELDRVVAGLASEYFDFVAGCGDRCTILIADGRRAFVEDPSTFDLIVLDAFASDAVPTHLLTEEALDVYRSRLAPEGVLAFHVTNHHVDVEAVVVASAQARGLATLVGRYDPGTDREHDPEVVERYLAGTTWVFAARDPAALRDFDHGWSGTSFVPFAGTPTRAWTDARSSVLRSLR